MQHPSVDFLAILRVLRAHRVDFVIVGGVAAVLQGAPLATFDLDLVHSRKEENIAHMASALEDLDAFCRDRGAQRIRPTASHLASTGHQLLMTRFGALDLLGAIGADLDYEDLLPHAIELDAEGDRFRVLDLKQIIHLKEQLAQEKDRAVLPLLRETLRERNRLR